MRAGENYLKVKNIKKKREDFDQRKNGGWGTTVDLSKNSFHFFQKSARENAEIRNLTG